MLFEITIFKLLFEINIADICICRYIITYMYNNLIHCIILYLSILA